MTPGALLLALVLCSADEWDGLRSRIASAGDVNCDGIPDLLLASRGHPREIVWVLCGRDGAVLYSVMSDSTGDGFGRSLAGIGDADGDGYADFAVGAQRADSRDSGYAGVYSGRDGKQLQRLESAFPLDSFGQCVAGGGDVDGDGRGDVVVTSGSPFSGDSHAYVHSGRTGALLADLSGCWGATVAALGPDQDGDGKAETLIAYSPPLATGPQLGLTCEVRWGLERARAIAVTSFPDCPSPGWGLSADGDADGDGTSDVLVSRVNCGIDLFSGRSQRLLRSVSYTSHDITGAATSLDWLGDLDFDGCDDFVVAANEADWGGTDPGFALVYSGRTGEVLHTYDPGRKRMDACRAGDANLDGIPDVAVFVVEDRAVRVLSGDDLHVVWEVLIDDLRR